MQKEQALLLLADLNARVTELEETCKTLEDGIAAAQEREIETPDEDGGDGDGNQDTVDPDLRDLEDALDLVDFAAKLIGRMVGALPELPQEVAPPHVFPPEITYEERDALQQEPILEPGVKPQGDDAALPEGAVILGGQYRLVRLLRQRPRVNLYLAQRLLLQDGPPLQAETYEQAVAIRELVLTGLTPQVRAQVEEAAFEEYVSPLLPGSLRVPGTGERVRIADERHYLVMQLGSDERKAMPLSDLLLKRRRWPAWLDMKMALTWGAQLCRIVARLHRLGVVLGDLDPQTILVDGEGAANWPPTLLVSWPPAPNFWPDKAGEPFSLELHDEIFPVAIPATDNAFAAPEVAQGAADERADVYSLGAILYLLLTRYAPVAAARQLPRLAQAQAIAGMPYANERITLIAPSRLDSRIPPELEDIVLRALALEPEKRFGDVFAMVEALEGVDANKQLDHRFTPAHGLRVAKGVSNGFPWFRRP